MTIMAKKELVSATKPRYLKADKQGKSKILDEFCHNTNYARKYAIKILAAGYDNNRVAKVGRKRRIKIYGSEVISVVIKIWELLDFPCGARLAPNLPEMYATLTRFKEIVFNENIEAKLTTISAKTLDRRLKREREIRHLKKNRGMTL